MTDELQAPNAFDTEWTSRPIGPVWPWIGAVTGALAIALGAVFFSPVGADVLGGKSLPASPATRSIVD